MPSNNVTVTLSTSSPGTTTIQQPGKLTFTNSTGVSITLTLPTCVSPNGGQSVSLANGASTQQYNVSNNQNGNYGYSYTGTWPEGDTLSGTIDVS
jgi:hypothetical protein